MPFVRCREYDDDGNPKRPLGCPSGRSCDFVHPDNPYWPKAPRPRRNPAPSQPFSSSRGRGRGRGRGDPPNRTQDRTGSNTTPIGGGSGSRNGSGWGSKSKGGWSADWGGGGSDNNEGSSSGFWSTGWGSTDDSKKDAGAVEDKGKGKGKATETSWGWGAADTEGADSGLTGWATDDGWGKAQGWGRSDTDSPKLSWNASEWINEQGSSKRSSATPSAEKQPVDRDEIKEKDKPTKLKIPPSPVPSAKMGAYSPQTPVQPASTTSWRDIKSFASPNINTGPGSLLRRQVTPDVITPSSRSGSVIPVNPPPRETRSLRSVSHKEAKGVWNEYIELVRRSIMLRLILVEERAHHKAYRAAQNSPKYTKVGSRGTALLDDSMNSLKRRLDRNEKAYKVALDRLCAFEEGFDFVMHALISRDVDPRKLREELSSLRDFVEEVRICVDGMQSTAEDIESKAKVIKPATTSATQATEVKPAPSVHRTQEQELIDRLKHLEENASELFNALLDTRDISNADVLVREKVGRLRSNLEDTLETEGREFFEKIDIMKEDHASLGRDMDEVCNEVTDMLTSVRKAELLAEQEIAQLRATLDEEKRILAVSEANMKECQDLLDKSNESLSLLRQELRAFEESKTKRPEELLNQLVAALLPAIRKELYPDIDSALDIMTSGVGTAVTEQSEEQVQALYAALAPVYKVAREVYERMDPKKTQSLNIDPRPASIHAGEGRVDA